MRPSVMTNHAWRDNFVGISQGLATEWDRAGGAPGLWLPPGPRNCPGGLAGEYGDRGPLLTAGAIAMRNTLEAMTGALLLTRYRGSI